MLTRDIGSAAVRVLSTPQRLRFLARGGGKNAIDLGRFLTQVVPLARAELHAMELSARRIPDPTLRALALSSLNQKAYHVAGGCILATFLPRTARKRYVRIIAPLESIYDYLDSLCDRHPAIGTQAVSRLHEAIADALDPARPLHEYYAGGPPGDDDGYLRELVKRTRSELERLPQLPLLAPHFAEAARLYADHQRLKHEPAERWNGDFSAWHAHDGARSRDLTWWEYAAAAGSQLQIYGPLYCAFRGDGDQITAAYGAYFPEIAGLHVLLDSFIDQAEDRRHTELNWVSCYLEPEDFIARARILAARGRERLSTLKEPRAHEFMLRVMMLFYLSHPKIGRQRLDRQAVALLRG